MKQPAILDKQSAPQAFLEGIQSIIKRITTGAPLRSTLKDIVLLIEESSIDGPMGSVLLADEQRKHLRMGAAASLPVEFNRAIDGIHIAEGYGLCGTTAFRKQVVYSENIAEDPEWVLYRELAVAYGLASCWSVPLISSKGQILGTFALYYHHTGKPSFEDLHMLEWASMIAIIAIELQMKSQ